MHCQTLSQRTGTCGYNRSYRASSKPTSSAPLPRHQNPATAPSRGLYAPSATATTTSLPALDPLDDNFIDNHTFSDYANWLVRDHVMVGRYPFVDHVYCTSRDQGEELMTQLLKAGISTFVSLQDEIPSQENFKIGGKNGFLPYKSTAELIQASLNGPPPVELVNGALRNAQTNQFLPPNRHHRAEQMQYKPKQPHFLHRPMPEQGLPSADAVEALLKELRQLLEAGEKLYIHGACGRGRAAVVGACLLAQFYGVSADEALDRVQRAFDSRTPGAPQQASPEAQNGQVEFVRAYVKAKVQQ